MRRYLVATLAAILCAAPLRAQSAADSALEAGDLAKADSLYYIAVRYRPRDPIAREALGRYLAARGATRIATVLLEEARLFGADPSRIAAELAPLYESLGDWRALLTLPSSPLTTVERKRAAWLAEHPSATRTGTGSQLLVGLPTGDTLGRVALHAGSQAAMAAVVARDDGVSIGSGLVGGLALLFDPADSNVVTVDSVAVGAARLYNVPARMIASAQTVTVGLGALAAQTPTFDYGKGRITFGRPVIAADWVRLPFLRDEKGLRVLSGGHWVSLAAFAAEMARGRRAFTVDFRAGEILIQPQ